MDTECVGALHCWGNEWQLLPISTAFKRTERNLRGAAGPDGAGPLPGIHSLGEAPD